MTQEDDFSLANRIDHEGLFANPEDSLQEYISFISKRRKNSQQLPKELLNAFLFHLDVDISKIPIEKSSVGLMPWEAACCWTDDTGDSIIRVRPETSMTHINRTIVLAHELIHAIRGRIGSTVFEEYTAYGATAYMFPNYLPQWRTLLGPLFSSSFEVISLLAIVWGSWLVPFFFSLPFTPFLLLPPTIIAALFIRLITRWKVWYLAFNALKNNFRENALSLLVRLSDSEIYWISKLPQEQIQPAFLQRATNEWRFRLFEKFFSLKR